MFFLLLFLCIIYLLNYKCFILLQVFIRELISNASDALEKQRYLQLGATAGTEASAQPLEINIALDEEKKTFTIQVGAL